MEKNIKKIKCKDQLKKKNLLKNGIYLNYPYLTNQSFERDRGFLRTPSILGSP